MRRRSSKIQSRSQRRDNLLDSPNGSDIECRNGDMMKMWLLLRQLEELREPELEEQMEAQAGPGSFLADLQEEPKTDLNETKKLLEISLLENLFLQEELKKLRDDSDINSIKQKLEEERCKCIELEQKVNDAIKLGVEDSPSQSPKPPSSQPTEKHKEPLCNSFLEWLYNRFAVDIEDFGFQPETIVETEEPLRARRLAENMRRLKRDVRPVTDFMDNLSALTSWYSGSTSAIAFVVYMCAAWHGWIISIFLFHAIVRLTFNYLIFRGWIIVPEVCEPLEPPKENLTISEKCQLFFDVAQKAQNLIGKIADILEKIKNLFMWIQPELTLKLYLALWVIFISSCLLPCQVLGFITAAYVGFKFFIFDVIFKSFPELQQRFDTSFIIWTNLPTDLQLKESSNTTRSRQVATTETQESVCLHVV
ncbi:GRAM domain-containing protein 4-like [Poeciliopsis prolifica]|uniref:GRAM domain-containing protein 4-like n=1 Tax=Poeciliopsis prolifica TaxID=188132 RepID=UPI0024133A2B|nr:GRAM domain-containing protein 4-like [Poeciliopsis prolifica]